MPKDDISFEDLEKQLAEDALEKALKDLYEEINNEILRNKKGFSEEISKTLISFRQNLEQKVTETIDKKIAALFAEHFSEASSQVKSSFEQMFCPVLQKTEDKMKRLQNQGNSTLNSWKNMMLQYTGLWTKPFFLLFIACVLTGTAISIFFTLYMITEEKSARHLCESNLQWYMEEYFKRKKAEEAAAKQKAGNQAKNQRKNKKN